MAYEATGPVKHKVVNVSSAASNAIVALVTGKKIRILSYTLVPAADVTGTWEDGDGNDLIGPMALGIKGGVAAPEVQAGHQETPASKALHLLLGSAVQVGGSLTYQEVT